MMQDFFELNEDRELSIEDRVAEIEGEIAVDKLNRNLSFMGILALIIILIAAVSLCVIHLKEFSDSTSPWFGFAIVFGVFYAAFGGFGLVALSQEIHNHQTSIYKSKSKLKALQERENTNSRGEQVERESNYFNQLVLINANNLRENYKTVTNQNKTSFKLAVITSMIGFALLLAGLSIGLLKVPQFNFSPFLSTASGIVVEFIAGVFFLFHSRSVQQMKEYHLNIIKTQNTLFAFKLIEDTKDKDTKAKIIAMIASRLMGENDSIEDLKK